jgi:TonB family protein
MESVAQTTGPVKLEAEGRCAITDPRRSEIRSARSPLSLPDRTFLAGAVLVIGAIAFPVASAAADAAPDLSAGVAAILRELPDADSVLVEREWMAPRSTRPAATGEALPPGSKGQRRDAPPRAPKEQKMPSEVGRPGTQWTVRFAKALEAGRVDPDRPCVTTAAPGDTTSRLMVWVRAHREGRIRHVQIRFEERCALISDKPFGASLDISSVAQQLLDLAREALPRDSLLQNTALPPPIPVSQPPRAPSIVVAPPATHELPKFGEYVYVEELPEAVEKPRPVAPSGMEGVSGTVLVQALVGKDGLVKDVRVVKSIPTLDAAAIESVRRWKFNPALSHGEPVPVWVAVPVRFGGQ